MPSFRCPFCDGQVVYTIDLAGSLVRCRHSGQRLQMPVEHCGGETKAAFPKSGNAGFMNVNPDQGTAGKELRWP